MIRVSISFKYDDDFGTKSYNIEEEFLKHGFDLSGSAVGFGCRDIDFEYNKKVKTELLFKKTNEIYNWLINQFDKQDLYLFSVDYIYNWSKDE